MNIKVFNEWGLMVWEGMSQSDTWDGTSKGKTQPAGNYVYMFTVYKKGQTEPYSEQGVITLIR